MRLARLAFALPLAAFMTAGCHYASNAVTADKAWVRLAPMPGRPAAAYVTIHGGAQPAELIAIDSPAAGSSELHRSMEMVGGIMQMKRLDSVAVPPRATVSFAPGGYHVMLFGVSPRVKPGDRMPLTLRFAKGEPITIKARVVAAGDAAPY
ncbi:MAG TPA: copper chaperone PCu(A)C [Sphingomonas sp.]|nr:copper chaperone PCu(A)C [Sphingomonas sp.]